jgi:hypothetical protein
MAYMLRARELLLRRHLLVCKSYINDTVSQILVRQAAVHTAHSSSYPVLGASVWNSHILTVGFLGSPVASPNRPVSSVRPF